MKKQKKRSAVPFKIISIIIVSLVILTPLIIYLLGLFKSWDRFKIKEIIVRGQEGNLDLSYMKGKNILNIDLDKEAAYLLESCSQCSKIRLARVFPDRLFVDFIKRRPCAYIKLNKYFAIDEEGVVFNPGQEIDSGLPRIVGLEKKILSPKPGVKYNEKELKIALEIIKGINQNKLFDNFVIREVGFDNEDGFIIKSSFIKDNSPPADDLIVKFPGTNIKEKIIILSGLIRSIRKDAINIKYVDLRFKDPVIKLRDAK
jgi:cell division septal protein FtsQ